MLKLFEVKQCSGRIILVKILVDQQVLGFLPVYAPQYYLKDAVMDLFYDQQRDIEPHRRHCGMSLSKTLILA